jgi:hypothetical protein
MMKPRRHRSILAAVLLAGCGSSPDGPPPPIQSAYSSTGEIRVARYYHVLNDRITKQDINVYRVLLSKTWVARRGEKCNDAFCRLAFPATAPAEDFAMVALLDQFAKNGFFSFPQRPGVHPDDILIPGKKTDVLVVETDLQCVIVFERDLPSFPLKRSYLQCVKVFEQLAEANRPAVIGVGVEHRDTYLQRLLQAPPAEAPAEPKATGSLKPTPFTPEARRRMEDEARKEEERKRAGEGKGAPDPAPNAPAPGPPEAR